jgi:hypothetical protein
MKKNSIALQNSLKQVINNFVTLYGRALFNQGFPSKSREKWTHFRDDTVNIMSTFKKER